MQSRIAEFRQLDAEILAVSSDDPEHGRQLAESYGIEYALLADPELRVIDAWGLRHAGGGIAGDVARPATFVLDREGRIVWRNFTENWRVRPRVETLLEVLEGIP